MAATGRRWSDLLLAGVVAFAAALTGWTVLRGMDAGSTAPGAGGPGPAAVGTDVGGSASAGPLASGSVFTTRSTISRSGTLRTRGRVAFEDPVASMTVSVPGADAAWLAGYFDPRVAKLRVRAGGSTVPGLPSRLLAGARLSVSLPPGTTAVSLSYEVTGVMVRTTTSSSQRALVLVNPVSVAAGRLLPTTVTVSGANVLNLGCSGPDLAPTACGTLSRDGWTVANAVRSGDVEVVAQLDLPRRG